MSLNRLSPMGCLFFCFLEDLEEAVNQVCCVIFFIPGLEFCEKEHGDDIIL